MQKYRTTWDTIKYRNFFSNTNMFGVVLLLLNKALNNGVFIMTSLSKNPLYKRSKTFPLN